MYCSFSFVPLFSCSFLLFPVSRLFLLHLYARKCCRSHMESIAIDSLQRPAGKKRSRIFRAIFGSRGDLDYRDLDYRDHDSRKKNTPVFGAFLMQILP